MPLEERLQVKLVSHVQLIAIDNWNLKMQLNFLYKIKKIYHIAVAGGGGGGEALQPAAVAGGGGLMTISEMESVDYLSNWLCSEFLM